MLTQYTYPDGTQGYSEPSDGQIFILWDYTQKPKQMFQWDSSKQRWYDITVYGGSNENESSTMYINTSTEEIKCECGSEKVGSNMHSKWCGKYTV